MAGVAGAAAGVEGENLMLALRRRGRIYHVRGTIRVGQTTHVVKEHSSGCDRREDAEVYRAKLESQIREEALHGQAGRARTMTFADCGLLYIGRPGGLHRNDVWRVGELNRFLGDYTIDRCPDGWAVFKDKRCRGLAAGTVARFRDTLQAALNYAAREGGFRAPQIPRLPPRKKRVRFLSLKERDRLIAAYAPRARPIAEMLCYQGCRTQEALQLQWQHVDLAAESIYFERTKNGRPRTVPMQHRVRVALYKLHEERGRPSQGPCVPQQPWETLWRH